MRAADDQVTLRVRLTNACWRDLNERARLRKTALGTYTDMLFRYALHEDLANSKTAPAEEDEAVYFQLTVPGATRRRLAEKSEGHRSSIASFSGRLLASYLARFATDPRDLGMVHYLASRLELKPVLSDSDLRLGIELCERHPAVRLPPGYLARWIYTRIWPLLREVERDGARIGVTPNLVAEFLALSQEQDP